MFVIALACGALVCPSYKLPVDHKTGQPVQFPSVIACQRYADQLMSRPRLRPPAGSSLVCKHAP